MNFLPKMSASPLKPLTLRMLKDDSNAIFKASLNELFNRRTKNKEFQGPTTESNQLVDSLITVGAYPAPPDGITPESVGNLLNALVQFGIEVFVCMNSEYGTRRDHPAYGPKTQDSNTLFCDFGLPRLPEHITFINMPIKDMNTGDPHQIIKLCLTIETFVRNGKHVYIHCSGGHGRTGIIAAIVLWLLYKAPVDEIFAYLQYAHDQREATYSNINHARYIKERLFRLFELGQVPTPQTTDQRNQVRDIIKILQKRERLIKTIKRKLAKLAKKQQTIKSRSAKNCIRKEKRTLHSQLKKQLDFEEIV